MSETTTDFQDSVYQTSASPRYSISSAVIKKFSVTKTPKASEMLLNARYLRANNGVAKVVVNLDSDAIQRSLLAKKINRSLAGNDFAEGNMRSDVYSSD